MKKVLAIIFVLIMVLQMSTGALAITAGETASSNVTGTYKAQTVATVYSVDISWSGLEFTYNEAFKGTWNADTLKYEGAKAAGWEGTGTITVTNNSNTAITAAAVYQQADGFETANMNFSASSVTVASADNGVNGAAGTAVSSTITVTPAGSLTESAGTAQTIGTITITIS